MHLPSLIFSGAAAWAVWGYSASCVACSVDGPASHRIEANPADQTPPSRPSARVRHIERGRHGACAGGGNCRDLSSITFRVQATDDVSPSTEVGYILEAEELRYDGERPLEAEESGDITVHTFGTEWEDRDFDVRVYAVDRAGNVSAEPTVVKVKFSGRCQIASDLVDGSLWTFAMLALLARSQRRRTNLTKA